MHQLTTTDGDLWIAVFTCTVLPSLAVLGSLGAPSPPTIPGSRLGVITDTVVSARQICHDTPCRLEDWMFRSLT